jgi:hypothetical protein
VPYQKDKFATMRGALWQIHFPWLKPFAETPWEKDCSVLPDAGA